MNATVVEVAKTKIIILVDHVEMTFARKKGSGVVLVGLLTNKITYSALSAC